MIETKTTGTIEIHRDGAIGRIVVSNPAKYNAMSFAMWQALTPAIQALDADPAIRVIVLEGEGEKAFISGADISEFETLRTDPASQARFNEVVDRAYKAPRNCRKPVVARIHGICMGGGLGLAAACDLRFCDDRARFRMPAGRLGLGYGMDGVRRFIACIGFQNTLDIFLSARIFDAPDALRMGFVSKVFAARELQAGVDAWLKEVVDNAPLTLAAVKMTAQAVLPGAPSAAEHEAMAAIAACFDSDDYREGAAAFMQKRPPRFVGR